MNPYAPLDWDDPGEFRFGFESPRPGAPAPVAAPTRPDLGGFQWYAEEAGDDLSEEALAWAATDELADCGKR
jgi:hypothetical protein